MASMLSCSSLNCATVTHAKAYTRAIGSITIKGFPETNSCRYQRSGLSVFCNAKEQKRVEEARKVQTNATDLLAQLLKADNPELFAREHAESLTQEFFMIASTYLSMAKKEGNAEVVNHLESTLKIAMQEREKILRPEIQLLNQLLRDKGTSERLKTMEMFADYVKTDGYFFQLLNRMTLDVEKQSTGRKNLEQVKLLSQLRSISKEAKDFSKNMKHLAR